MHVLFYVYLFGMKIEIMKDFFKKTFDLISVIGLCLVLTIVPVDAAMPDGNDTGQGSNPDDPTQIVLENELSEEIEDAEEDDESEDDKKSTDKSKKNSNKKSNSADTETGSETPENLTVTPTGAETNTDNTAAVTGTKPKEASNTPVADGEDNNTSRNENDPDESGKTSGENELSDNTEGNQLSEETTPKVNNTKSSETENQGTESDASVLTEHTLNNSNQTQTTETEGETALLVTNPASDTNEDAATSETPKKGEYPARENAEIENKYNDLIEGVAYIPSSGNSADEDLPVKYLYSDSYFEKSSIIEGENYNYDLAAISVLVANCSGYSSRAKMDDDGGKTNPNAPENQSKNIQTLLRELGFENIQVNGDYEKAGNPFTAGVLCATKKIQVDGEEYTLLGIFPRSFGYTIEWADNGTFGFKDSPDSEQESLYEGDAEGPSDSVNNNIIPFIQDYLRNSIDAGYIEKGDNFKIWSTGISRGGGLSMLTSAYLDKTLDEKGTTNRMFDVEGLNITNKDIYTYTFGTPNWAYETNAGTVTENTETGKQEFTPNPLYSNIHNFVVDYDILYKLFTGEPGNSWGLVHYGSDNILTTNKVIEDNKKLIQDMEAQYAALLQTNENGLIETGFFFKNKETNELEYKPFMSTYSYTKGTSTDENLYLAEFLTRYMATVTSKVDRDKDFAVNQDGIRAFLAVFLGQRNKIGDFTSSISFAAVDVLDDILEEAVAIYKDPERGIDDAIEYLRENLATEHLTSAIVTDAFKKADIQYKYDFSDPEKTESDITEKDAVELYKDYIPKLLNVVLKLALADNVSNSVNFYNAAGNLWSAHDVNIYASWIRHFSNESNYYLNKLNNGEKWGYRMVYLPESVEGFEINVYHGGKDCVKIDGLVGATLDGTIRSGKYYREEGFDPYVHIGFDLEGNKVLYLRSDKEYILEFTPQAESVDTKGLKIDEFNYEKYYEIFRPLHTITAEDNKIELEQIGQLISEGNYSLGDKLYLEIGGIKFEVDTNEIQKAAKMLKAAPAADAVSDHEAEYYLLAKLVELVGAVENETGGKVNSLDYYQTKMLINDPDGVSATLTASPLKGYRFVGWYTQNGTFVSKSLSFTKYFNFNDSSAVYYARFELIPDKKDDSKPAPAYIPTDGWNEINIPVEVTSLAPARTYRIPKTADNSRLDLWVMFFASLTAAGASMYLLKETE